jgi:hypothetical protein
VLGIFFEKLEEKLMDKITESQLMQYAFARGLEMAREKDTWVDIKDVFKELEERIIQEGKTDKDENNNVSR